jgi:hypothetical protein
VVDAAPAACENPARGVLWLTNDGRYMPVRCGRSNSCAYCAWLASRENTLTVALDAKQSPPTVGVTLTTQRPGFEMDRFRTATAAVFKRLRRDLGPVEYCGLMEWTTGRRTPGRRPHMHALVKGVDAASTAEVHELVRETWEASTDGAWVVECRPLRSAGGAIAYMVGHHHKSEQAPPEGWSGKRMRPSRGYFHRPVAEIREQARAKLRTDTATAKLIDELHAHGLDPDDVADQFDELLEAAVREPTPQLVRVRNRDGRLVDMTTGAVVPDPKDPQT